MSNPIHEMNVENELWKIRAASDELVNTESESQLQIRQLNDKVASQTLYIKQLQVNLNQEIDSRKALENKITRKEIWTYIITALASAIATYFVDHLF